MTYTLRVECEHKGKGALENEPPCLVKTVVHHPFAPGTSAASGWLEWRESGDGLPSARETYYGVARKLGRFGARKSDGSNLAPWELVPDMPGNRWNFHCVVCGEWVPVRDVNADPIFAGLRDAGMPRISLASLKRLVAH